MKNKHLISIAMGLLLLGCSKENIEVMVGKCQNISQRSFSMSIKPEAFK